MPTTWIRMLVAGVFPAAMIAGASLIAMVQFGLGDRTSAFKPAALTALFSGIAAMVVIETVKRMVPIRAAFQRRQVSEFMKEYRPISADEADRLPNYVIALHDALEDGLAGSLGRSRSIDSAFNLPAEQLVAQLGLAMDTYGEPGYTRSDYQVSDAELAGRGAMLDRLQIRLAARWRHYVQATAIWLSGWLSLVWSAVDEQPSSALHVLAALVFGGFIAWFARDIAAAIESWRR